MWSKNLVHGLTNSTVLGKLGTVSRLAMSQKGP